MVIEFEVDPGNDFRTAIADAIEGLDDLTVPLTLITKSWFKSNQFIFAVKGSSGKYVDLAPDNGRPGSSNYKAEKLKKWGFVYPVLKASGALEKSLTEPSDRDAISMLLNRKTLILGTKSPTAAYHQDGTKFMPARPPVLIGSEQTAPEELNTRKQLWIDTIVQYALKQAAKVGPVSGG